MMNFNNSSAIYISFGTLQNCSVPNFTIFTIYNSSFYLENTQFYDFHSLLIYSSLGFISIDHSIFSNSNNGILVNDSAIKLENGVSFTIKNSIFQNLFNFAKVIFLIQS